MPGSALFHKTFYAAYGFGPYECFFCRQPMTWMDMSDTRRPRMGCVHHIDENKDNNHPYNLAPGHTRCHNGWHNARRRGIQRTPAMQELLRTVNVGRTLTPAHKEAMSWKGRRHSPETRKKMAEARRAWWARKKGN